MNEEKNLFQEELKERIAKINASLRLFLPAECGFQKNLLAACNYSVENGGKRLRPLFMQLAYELCQSQDAKGEPFGENTDKALLPFMAAIEMIHSSSLVHDDLPCMDNDRLRRGKLSTWAKYGEDMGTLAGDGLMIYAVEIACKSEAAPERKAEAIRILTAKTGIYGMIGGQSVDVELTGSRPTKEELTFIYRNKTGALLEAAFMIGGVLVGASPEIVKKLEEAAGAVGMAFQIEDDILDETATEEALGKPTGSDERNEKVTWLTYYGLEQSRADVRAYTERAVSCLEEIGQLPFLTELCRMLIDRRS